MPRLAPDTMDLKSLRCFSLVARHLSIAKSSLELGISEAAVSQRVHGLETHLRAKLYEARGGRIELTAAGERTARLAVSVFGQIAALEGEVAGAKETAQITLSSHDSVLRYLLPDKVEAFRRAHPLARLRLVARPVEETLRLVRANECDLGVIPERAVPEDLAFRAVAKYPACLILQKGHPLARRGAGDIEGLLADGKTGRYPLVLLEVQREDRRLEEAFARQRLPFEVGLEVSTIDTLKHYVKRGLGVGVVSGFCITAEDRARLDVLPIPAEFGGDTTYGVLLRRDKHRAPLLKSLLATLASFDEAGPVTGLRRVTAG
ncbi:MAG TPA: LysR family transcriptional regulator [Steroidobacteraceae bacterium]|nr:LysR family transcriptional regulator [Steroidobacteraceae bacterium]